MKILALFPDSDSAMQAVERLAPVEYEIYSAEPLDPSPVPSRLGKVTVLGGLAGAIAGAALAALTAKSMGLYTGGMPLVAYAPVGIITFAGAGLGAVSAALGTLLWEAGLLTLRLELPELVRQEIAAGAVALTIPTEENRRAAVEEVLARAGAKTQLLASNPWAPETR